MVDFKGGRLPNNPEKPRLLLGQFMDAKTIIFPSVVDYASAVHDWGMMLNDQLGDCTCADLGHTIKQTSLYGEGTEISVTDDDVLKAYKAVSGYNGTPETDNGAVIQDVMNYWRKTGIAGHKSLAFAEVNVYSMDEVLASIFYFGSVHFGMNFPAFAMDQFNSGSGVWEISSHNTQIEGGHDVVGVGYDRDEGTITVVTWGETIKVTNAFFQRYFEEGWVAILPEWINDYSEKTPTGLDLYGMGETMVTLGIVSSNPFPPPPQPVPTPVPVPFTADPLDQELWTTVEEWAYARHATTNKAAATAVKAWATKKGLQ